MFRYCRLRKRAGHLLHLLRHTPLQGLLARLGLGHQKILHGIERAGLRKYFRDSTARRIAHPEKSSPPLALILFENGLWGETGSALGDSYGAVLKREP